ncbi:ATP-dependent helicase HrpB [Brachybacterium sp. AOP25-B2-12]|uniref:ATP-dependent helicase HrpB n=1 Tax=Brachybacterium sp. AOP25-B2-12 TaxID=3457710 RepID=UPI00403368FC
MSPDPSTSPGPRPFDLAVIGRGLPVAAALGDLASAAATGAMVVTAPPGTGKTTFVPPLLADRSPGPVLLVQPRRVAVRAAARRLAALDGTAVGDRVGFTVRGERRISASTRIEVLTPGVLLRRLLRDPVLEGAGAVVLDEVHERSLDVDLLLGMLADARTLREVLQVTAMSATLDAEAVARVLGGGTPVPVVDVPSALHPLTIRYDAPGTPRLDRRGVTSAVLDHLARIASHAHTAAGDDDALVFVPGAREVDEVTRRLRGLTGAEVLPLHGRLPPREQDRATRGRAPGEGPRIIVSTALAESSLTVPGVRLVIDAGLSREVRRDRGRDMTGLVTVSASRASAEQRAGRAARETPGTVVRAYDETDFARMRAASPPEITAADLTDAALLLACWGTPRGEGLGLLTPPPPAAIADAESTLRGLGLVDDDGRATPAGRTVAGLPVGVREARALLDGARELGDAEVAAEIVAALTDDLRAEGADLTRALVDLRAGRSPATQRWRQETRRLRGIAREHAAREASPAGPGGPSAPRAARGTRGSPDLAAGTILALARPERIARRVATGSRSLLLASGTRAALPEGSTLADREWLAVWTVQRAEGRAADGTGAVVRLAAPLDEGTALRLGEPLMTRGRITRLDGTKVVAREEHRLGAIVLSSTPVAAAPEDAVPALLTHVRENGLESLTWSDAARTLRGRLALLHRELGAPWPAMDDDALLGNLDGWLAPTLAGIRGPVRADRVDLTAALRTLLPWPEASHLDSLAPERLAVPSGSSVRIEYPDPQDAAGRPVVAVKLQECFGLAETPRLVDGRVPVLFHLLSPARRPLAVTDDLRSFWTGPYAEVRKEMRGRYPRHPWPEDPWSAPATARTTHGRGGIRRP